MKKFILSDNIEAICDSKKTRNGFKHTATLLIDGNEQESVKVNYLNRTWERYEYQSVLEKLVENSKILNETEKTKAKNIIENYKESNDMFRSIAMVAKMGEIFCQNDQKKTNDWKERMIKTGLENQGFIMPDDWNNLNENEKEKRLNGVIKILTEKS